MKQAMHWEKRKEKVQCLLCPRDCVIPKNQTGYCRVRQNKNNILYSLVYGKAAGLQIDPIEKKPLFHFIPGNAALSFGTVGCTFVCKHCQNWTTSQSKPEEGHSLSISPKQIVETAIKEKCTSIAYTYNEPTVFYEYMLDTAKLARKKGLKNIIVSNGFIEKKPLLELCKYIDGANIDLKSIEDQFYKKIAGAWIGPVLETLKTLHKQKIWLEITNLLIPTLNDKQTQINKLVQWIKDNLNTNIPLHFSAFYPTYKLQDLPPTQAATLIKAKEIAVKKGMKYVYLGNIATSKEENTYCPKCGKLLIQRSKYNTIKNNLHKGKCTCGYQIPGVWA